MKNLSIFEPQIEKHSAYKKQVVCILFTPWFRLYGIDAKCIKAKFRTILLKFSIRSLWLLFVIDENRLIQSFFTILTSI